MNHSIYSADRMTHVKIGVTALIVGIVAVSVGIAIRLSNPDHPPGEKRPRPCPYDRIATVPYESDCRASFGSAGDALAQTQMRQIKPLVSIITDLMAMPHKTLFGT